MALSRLATTLALEAAGDDDGDAILLLPMLGQSKRSRPSYHQYAELDLDNYTDEECFTLFRFNKEKIHRLFNVFQIPGTFTTTAGTTMPGLQAFVLVLRRLTYPNRHSNIAAMFGREIPELSMVFNTVIDYLYARYGHLLLDLDQPWLSPDNLRRLADSVHDKGAPLTNCWGFIDGTARPICRPTINQRAVFSGLPAENVCARCGHKRLHVIKFQSIMAPNGIIAHLFGPFEGSRHDAAMLAESNILDRMENTLGGFYVYGDPAYPIRRSIIAPFRGANLSPDQDNFNYEMSKVRQCVEWGFGDIVRNFAFLDFRKNLKLYLQPVGKYYAVGALLTNCRACLRGNSTSGYFEMEPPKLEDYVR